MTDNESNKSVIERMREHVADPYHAKTEWEGRKVDPLLQWMVDNINRSTNKHAVNFTVGGNLISGILVSADAYFDQFAEDFSSRYESEKGSAAAVRAQILDFKLNLVDSDAEAPPAQFVHLLNAEVFTSDGRPIVSGGCLWRGKISSIDGFSMGLIEAAVVRSD